MNFAMARSSITLSDRQGIIDIPYRYLLTSVSSWVYFRLAAQSQVSYSTKKNVFSSNITSETQNRVTQSHFLIPILHGSFLLFLF